MIFTGCWPHRPLPPGTHQNSRLPGGKQTLGTVPVVCMGSLGTVRHPYRLGKAGTFPKSRFPSLNQGPASQAGSLQDSSLVPNVVREPFSSHTSINFHISNVQHHVLLLSLFSLEPYSAPFTTNTRHSISLHSLLKPDTHSAPFTLC